MVKLYHPVGFDVAVGELLHFWRFRGNKHENAWGSPRLGVIHSGDKTYKQTKYVVSYEVQVRAFSLGGLQHVM